VTLKKKERVERIAELNQEPPSASVVSRYPRADHADFPLDPQWSAFAFPDGVQYSLTRPKPISYYAVMTLEDGTQLFAAYLTFYELVENVSVNGNKAKPPPPPVPPRPATMVLKRNSTGGAPMKPRPPPLPDLYVQKSICLVSHYPQFMMLRDCLTEIFKAEKLRSLSFPSQDSDAVDNGSGGSALSIKNGGSETSKKEDKLAPIERYIAQLIFEVPLPVPGQYCIEFFIRERRLSCSFPAVRSPLMSSFPLRFLFRMLSVDNILTILAAVIAEGRILFNSASLHNLTVASQCILQLLHPFQWWYAYIPCLTLQMLDAHEIPQPYILGVHSKYLSLLTDTTGVVIVDIDHNTVRCDEPLTQLPDEEGGRLRDSLRALVEADVSSQFDALPSSLLFDPPSTSSNTTASHTLASNTTRSPRDDKLHGLAGHYGSDLSPYGRMRNEAFDQKVLCALQRFYADIVGGYRKFLFFIEDVPFFNGTGFLQYRTTKSPTNAEFFRTFLESRAFDVYLDEELQPDEYHNFIADGVSLQHKCLGHKEQLKTFTIPHPPAFVPPSPFKTQKRTLRKGASAAIPSESESGSNSSSSSSSSGRLFAGPAAPELFGEHSLRLITMPCPSRTPILSTRRRPRHLDSERSNSTTYEEQLKFYMSKVFSSDSIEDSEKVAVEALLRAAPARRVLTDILGQPKLQGSTSLCLAQGGFDALVSILMKALDFAVADSPPDYISPTSVLDASTVYFTENVSGARTYIETYIRSHSVWRNTDYWKHALQVAVVQSNVGVASEEKTGEKEEFILQWMITATHQMLSCGMETQVVQSLMEEMCRKYGMASGHLETLLAFLENIKAAMENWH